MANGRGKRSGYKPKYGVKEVRRLVDAGRGAIERGGAPGDPWLFVAASHALDFYEAFSDGAAGIAVLGNGSGGKLDFTGGTMGQVDLAVAISAMQLQSQGKADAEVRQTLAKRLAAYTMIQVYNDLEEMGLKPGFACGESAYALNATAADGKAYSFDFLPAARLGLLGFQLGGAGGGAVGGSLQPYHQRYYEGFLEPLFDSIGLGRDARHAGAR